MLSRERLRPPQESDFSSRLRSAAVAARVGLWLGICFVLAFITGLISHYAQLPHPPIPLPSSPSWGYRLTQTVHVVTGTAAVPLLLVKLWVVYPKLFQPIPRKFGALFVSGLERLSIGVLVSSAVLELTIGIMNVAQWYVWPFDFKKTHYALAFVVIGALIVHIAVKLPVIRTALGADIEGTDVDRPTAVRPGVLTRRGVVRISWVAAGLAVIAGSSAAGTAPVLNRIAVLSARSRKYGIPINRTAAQAGVVAQISRADNVCSVIHGSRTMTYSRDELLVLPQSTHTLPIACVEGWSRSGTWTGVPLRHLLDLVGAETGRQVMVQSVQRGTTESQTILPADFADDSRTLLALHLDGEPLSYDHGYPARLIAPDRPGALQTKWVSRIEVL